MAHLDSNYEGSISEGTMRAQDLLPRCINVLRQVVPQHATVIDFDSHMAAAQTLGEEVGISRDDVLDLLGYWDSESVNYMLNEDVFEMLNSVAPEGCYFGSSEGDGASYGFWYSYEECPLCFERHDPDDDCDEDDGDVVLAEGE